MKEQKLIDLLKQVNEEVKKLEEQGYTVEIELPSSKYRPSLEVMTKVKVYKPISF